MRGQSIFRFAKVLPDKQEYKHAQLFAPSATSSSIACSSRFIATNAVSNGRVAVLPTDFSLYKSKNIPATISAHAGGVADLAFSPFHPELLATCGDECVRGWKIPTAGGLEEDLTESTFNVSNQCGLANALRFHPHVDGLLAVGCKAGVQLVDVNSAKVCASFELKDAAVSIAWDYFGKQLACIGKNYQMFLADPRTANDTTLAGTKASGFRPQNAVFNGRTNRLIVAGLSSSRQPELRMFDPRNLSESLIEQELNLSPGLMMPLYDIDTHLLALTLRGSSVVRLYDVTKAVKRGEMKQIANKMLPSSLNGTCAMPKWGCDVMQTEVMKMFSTTKDGTIMPISIRVPRKIDGFHEELYPDTLPNKASDVDLGAWMEGKDPLIRLVSVDSRLSNFNNQKVETKNTASKEELEAKKKESIKAKVLKKSEVRARIECKLKRSAFVHLGGTQTRSKDAYYFDIKVDRPVNGHRNLDVNSKYIAFPWKTIGGSGVAIVERKVRKFGRLNDTFKVRGHSDQVTAFALSRLQPNLMATGSVDGLVKVWKLPEKLDSDQKEPSVTLECSGRVLGIAFHPRASNVLLTWSRGIDVCHMRLWDLQDAKEPKVLIEEHGEAEIMSVDFNADGSMIATTAKDGKLRVIDLRANKTVKEFSIDEATRGAHAFWLNVKGDKIATVGFAKGNDRQIGIYNVEDGKSLASVDFDGDSGAMMPYFDIDTKLLYVASSGAPSIQFFLLSENSPYVEKLSAFKAHHDFKGFKMLPKIESNVKAVEVNVGWQLGKNELKSISFTLPRKRAEFFQDDIFIPTASMKPTASSKHWFDRKESTVKYISLQPTGMTPLSQAPKEELTERQKKYQSQKLAAVKPKAKGCLGHETAAEVRAHFQNLATLMDTNSNPWDAGGEQEDDDDWSD